jgi:CBS domain containing-hemolysin-like protein
MAIDTRIKVVEQAKEVAARYVNAAVEFDRINAEKVITIREDITSSLVFDDLRNAEMELIELGYSEIIVDLDHAAILIRHKIKPSLDHLFS